MKKFIAILITLMMTVSVAMADVTFETGAVTIALDANATTGYVWSGFVMAGDAVVLESAEGCYVPAPAEEGMVGVGGKTYFTLIPVQVGTAVVTFTYMQPWNPETAEQLVLVAEVYDEGEGLRMDVCEAGVLTGTVVSVDADDLSVVLMTETHGEIVARFDVDTALPVVDEQIVIYTNGTMTMSLPAIVNVIAWATVPGDLARTDAE